MYIWLLCAASFAFLARYLLGPLLTWSGISLDILRDPIARVCMLFFAIATMFFAVEYFLGYKPAQSEESNQKR